MKTGIKIVQFRDGMWGAKKRGWFGWKYWRHSSLFNEMEWSLRLPKWDGKDRFCSKKLVVTTLSKRYHSYRERR